jgi:hypothetical protein
MFKYLVIGRTKMKENFTTCHRVWPSSTWIPDNINSPIWKTIGLDFTNPAQDDIHGKIDSQGVWHNVVKYQACATQQDETSIDNSHFEPYYTKLRVYGLRTLNHSRQSGYELEGFVSIGRKYHSAFTSSFMIEYNGKLVNIAEIFARTIKNKE